MPDWNSNTNPDRNADANTHTHPDADAHTNPDTNAYTNTNTYTDTGADHTARAWLQSARPANGGPLLEWADLG